MEIIDARPFSLAMAPPQSDLRVEKVLGSNQFTKRIADIGITPGSRIRITQRNGKSLIVERGELYFVLGGVMAQHIFVSQLTE